MRLRREIGWLRSQRALGAVYRSLAAGCDRFGTRVVHFSVQGDHLHLLAEATDRRALARAMKGLSVRIARALNRVIGRRGTVFGDRYHTRGLGSPREVHGALIYVLCNIRKHEAQRGNRCPRGWIDPCSSGAHFDGWIGARPRPPGRRPPLEAPELCEARIWLLTKGWRRLGPIDVNSIPGVATT